MIHLVHPTGNTNVRALLEALQRSGAAYRFWTTLAFPAGGPPSWLPGTLRSQLGRRSFDVPAGNLRTRPWREGLRLAAPLLKWRGLSRHETGWASVDAVYRDLDQAVATALEAGDGGSGRSWLYGYEDGALACFEAAQRQGWGRAYELPIAYWETSRRLLSEEAERWPQWQPTLVGPSDSQAKLERKRRELELAELVVVPSRFVEASLPAWLAPTQKVVVAPFGSPSSPPAALPRPTGKPLRVLFAGSMSQRKGLADVFEAMRRLGRFDVELVIMGSPSLPLEFYRGQGVPFRYEAPRPHAEVLQLMQTCDVLLLPSIVEGRALVQQEALACGLPLVVTSHAGGEDLVIEGHTGFLVPIRAPDAIAERLSWFADHRQELESMRRECRIKAAAYSWQRYANTILTALQVSGD